MRFSSALLMTAFVGLVGCSDSPGKRAKEAIRTNGSGDPVLERQALETLADAMRTFHVDTDGWPFGDEKWSANDRKDVATGGVDPAAFSPQDVSLFQTGKMAACGLGQPKKCWNGPYLKSGNHLADEQWLDAWGRRRLFAIIPPQGRPGGLSAYPDGVVLVWSRGPDGVDQTGCTDGQCVRDLALLAQGKSSAPKSDDVVVIVGGSL